MSEAPKRRILVVDDEPLNRELLRRVLAREYHIEEAEDGAQALQLLGEAADGIELILCDQLMPGMSGTELAAEVRTRWPSMTFLLLTGFDEDPEVARARDSGLVHKVVAKPWRGAALKRLIERSLAS